MNYTLADFPDLVTAAKAAAKLRPDLKADIADLVYMARDEANDGGSASHESDLAIESINELILKEAK